MAMTIAVDDDHWPSLAPIRTSTSTSCLHVSDPICKTANLPEGSLQSAHVQASGVESSKNSPLSPSCIRSTLFNICSRLEQERAADTDLARQSSCSYTSKKSCAGLFSCFSCTKQASLPRPHRRCTPTCMRKNGPVLRSMAFLFPAGGFQSFYSSPTGKSAQLSGAFPRALSAGKLQHYASPRTPGNHSVSGKFQQFSSPRTPGSAGNLQCLSAPRTPASGKVQHFSGAIPSPRTPFGSGTATSPSSARRRKSSFTLFMPPATADKKKAAEQLDEPTSPHVTCIGRVRRQTHCKKLHHKDMINPRAHCHDTTAKKKGTYKKKLHSGSDSSASHSISSNEAAKSCMQISTTEACKQKFGRNQLQNLHKIDGFGDESRANAPDDITSPIANGHEELMHPDVLQNNGEHSSLTNVECMNGNINSLQEADHGFPANIRMHSDMDNKVEFTECDKTESVDTPVLYTTCSHSFNDLRQGEAHQSQCLDILNELQHGVHDQSQCQELGLQIDIFKTPQATDHCLLLMRNARSRKITIY